LQAARRARFLAGERSNELQGRCSEALKEGSESSAEAMETEEGGNSAASALPCQ
jgi:hypothetical protein